MGACYACNGCGKCRVWMDELKGKCPFCQTPYQEEDRLCASCGKPLPLKPGQPSKRVKATDGDTKSVSA